MESMGEDVPIEVVRTKSRPFGFALLQCGTKLDDNLSVMLSRSEEEEDEDNEEDNDDDDDDNDNDNDDNDDEDSRYEQPNRDTSLMEDDEEEDEEVVSGLQLVKSSSSAKEERQEPERTYHPALVVAEYAEGQEAIWSEDDVSTVVSVLVKPKEPAAGKPKKKSRFGALRQLIPAITIPEDKEIEPEVLQKIHVRKIKTKKTIVLLPQQSDEGAKTLVDENVKQEAAMNMVKARQLLNQALLAEGENRLEDSEMLAKSAFALATAARRLMTPPEEAPDLEEVLSVLAENGEHAAFEHQRIVFSQSFESPSQSNKEASKPKGKGVLSAATNYAVKAKEILESIFPKNVEQELQESLSQEIMASDTISTLGLKSDTSEYEMNTAPSNPSKSYTNMDLMSISSLNEILDAADDSNENILPSPRKMLPVIDVHIKTPLSTMPASAKKWISLSPRFHSGTSMSGKKEGASQAESKSQKAPASAEQENRPPKKEQEAPNKRKKGWGLLKKLRRNKYSKNDAPDIILEETTSLDEETEVIQEEMSKDDSNEIGVLTDGPSNSFESSNGVNSLISRYHIVKKNSNSSGESQSADSAPTKQEEEEEVVVVGKSQSIESIRPLDTCKSDWDQSVAFERNPVKPAKEIATKIISAPSRSSAGATPSASDGNLKRSISDWDEASSSEPSKKLMQKKSIASLSLDESSARDILSKSEEQSKQEKSSRRMETPISQWTASVATNFRSTQGNTGVETVAETEATESQTYQSKDVEEQEEEASSPAISETESSGVSVPEHASSKGRQHHSEKSESRQSESRMSREEAFAFPTEESTQAGKDSLINFVISPRRAHIMTPGGRKHFDTDRGDEPSRIVIPVLNPIGEIEREQPSVSIDIRDEDDSELNHHVVKPADKQPKIMRRISSLFAARKALANKGRQQHVGEESFDIEQQESGEKDLQQAISDGNMRAYEANLNAENAPSTLFPSDSVVKGDAEAEETPTIVLEQAMSNAEKKAEEANLEVEKAPFPHRRSRRKHPAAAARPVPLDLVDAIRMQAGLERNTRKTNDNTVVRQSNSGDAPGTSLHIEPTNTHEAPPRLDPPKDDVASYRVLAPTPRNNKKPTSTTGEGGGQDRAEPDEGASTTLHKVESEDSKNDQRRITELLYGPSTSSDSFAIQEKPTVKAERGVYIGDLIGRGSSSNNKPSTDQAAGVASSVSSENEEGLVPTTEDEGPKTDVTEDENDENKKKNIEDENEEEETPIDKENSENALASPKAGGGGTSTPRGRLGLGGKRPPRRSMLSGIRNLISPSGGHQY